MQPKLTLCVILWLCLCGSTIQTKAQNQVDTDFVAQMNTAFAPLNKSFIPTGFLQDYAFELADLGSYNGVLTDSNYVNTTILHNIYTTLAFSDIYSANAGTFYHPNYVDSLWYSQRQPGIITLGGLYYNYASFKSNAVSSGLITVTNNQFVDKYVNGVWQNPYQTQAVFAMSPPLHSYTGRTFQVKLPSNIWFTNNAAGISSFALDYGDGSGYHTITKDQLMNISYSDTGTKIWNFRLNLTNGTSLFSHTFMRILPEPNNAYTSMAIGPLRQGFTPNNHTPMPITATVAYNGQFGSGWITIDYANSDYKLRKPLIVVEGFDPGYLIEPEKQYGETTYATFINTLYQSSDLNGLLQGIGSTQQYDIIYVDWAQGADYLQRNGLLLETIINWVNQKKAADGVSTQPNVVLGQSMGGVISRWALKDMEQRGIVHQTRLFINWDGPQQGANVPLAYQYLSRHVRSLYVKSNIQFLLNTLGAVSNQIAVVGNVIANGLNLSDFPAPQQMLINHLNKTFSIDNTMHTAWQQELLIKGYPANCRNVSVSNGSECAYNQNFLPDVTLLSYNGTGSTSFLTDFISQSVFPIIGRVSYTTLAILLNKPQFLIGILPGKSTLSTTLLCKAQPPVNTTDVIYSGKITFTKKLLGLININTTITNKSYNSTPSIIPIDGSPGGFYDIGDNLQNSSLQSIFLKYSATASSIPQFNFVPTTSSLDIGSGATTLTTADYNTRYIGGKPPVAPYKSAFANFTTAFDQVLTSGNSIENNENHIQIATRNGLWVATELNNPLGPYPVSDCSAACGNTVITGPANFCVNGIYGVPDPGANGSVSWSASPSGIVSISSPNSAQTIVTKISDGTVTLTATVNSNTTCLGNSILPVSTTVAVGNQVTGYYNVSSNYVVSNNNTLAYGGGSVFIPSNQSVLFSIQITNTNFTGVSWSVSGAYSTYYSGSNFFNLYMVTPAIAYSSNNATVTIYATGPCGAFSKSYNFQAVSSGSSGFAIQVMPNPVDNTLTITQLDSISNSASSGTGSANNTAETTFSVSSTNTTTASTNNSLSAKTQPNKSVPEISGINKVRIFDMEGRLNKTTEGTGSKSLQIDVSKLSPGIYLIEVTSGTRIQRQKIVIQH